MKLESEVQGSRSRAFSSVKTFKWRGQGGWSGGKAWGRRRRVWKSGEGLSPSIPLPFFPNLIWNQWQPGEGGRESQCNNSEACWSKMSVPNMIFWKGEIQEPRTLTRPRPRLNEADTPHGGNGMGRVEEKGGSLSFINPWLGHGVLSSLLSFSHSFMKEPKTISIKPNTTAPPRPGPASPRRSHHCRSQRTKESKPITSPLLLSSQAQCLNWNWAGESSWKGKMKTQHPWK